MRNLSVLILLVITVGAFALLSAAGGRPAIPPPKPTAGLRGAVLPPEPPRIAVPEQAAEAEPSGGAAPPPPPSGLPPDFPLCLPKEFGPGPRIRGRIVSEAGVQLTDLSVRTTTWRPTGRGCFKPTYYLGWTELHPDGSFVFHVDAEMLRDLPERKGRIPFSIEADGHLDPKVELDPEQWAALVAGRDLVALEIRLRRAASLEVRVLQEDGSPCDRAVLYHSDKARGQFGSYRGHTEDGVWRMPKLDPAHRGYLTARQDGFVSEWAPFAGRLRAGETTRLVLRLARRHPATVTVVVRGYREGLVFKLGAYEFPLEGPIVTLETLTGPHLLRISGEDPWICESVSFEIPRNARNHTVEVDLSR